MNENKDKLLEKEVLREEYILGKNYYKKILDKAKEDNKESYK